MLTELNNASIGKQNSADEKMRVTHQQIFLRRDVEEM